MLLFATRDTTGPVAHFSVQKGLLFLSHFLTLQTAAQLQTDVSLSNPWAKNSDILSLQTLPSHPDDQNDAFLWDWHQVILSHPLYTFLYRSQVRSATARSGPLKFDPTPDITDSVQVSELLKRLPLACLDYGQRKIPTFKSCFGRVTLAMRSCLGHEVLFMVILL